MHTFDVEGALKIDLRLAAGDAELVTGPVGTASVELEARSSRGQELVDAARVEAEETRHGTRLVVHVPERGLRSWFTTRGDEVRVRITAPPDTTLDAHVASADLTVATDLAGARVTTASGDVALRDVRGQVSVRSASGDVHAGDVTGDADVGTASGDIVVGDVGGDAQLRTVSGDVRAGRAAGETTLRSVSGDLSVAEVAGSSVDANTTSGDIALALAAGRRIHLDVASVTGDLRSDLDVDDGGVSHGADVALRARTVSGDVHLRRAPAPAAPSTDAGSPEGPSPRSGGIAIL